MAYKDGCEYYGTHFWWDNYDREYTIVATWKYEKGYDIPDSWHLVDWEVESVDPPFSDNAWHYDPVVVEQYIKEEGAPFDLQEVDYI